MRFLPRTLAQKLILALTLIVALLEGAAGVYSVRRQERHLLATMVQGADQLSRGITSATWHAMLADHRQDAYEVMQTVASQEGISLIKIFNKEGRVMFSTAPGGPSQVDKKAEVCFLCHASEQPLVRVDVPTRSRTFRVADGGRRLAMVTPIYNEPAGSDAACHAHPESQNVLGVLDVVLDLEPVDRELRRFELRAVAQGAIHILLIGLFVFFFTRRFVGRPIDHLISATRDVSEMRLDRPVAVPEGGELGELARSFDSMRERLREAQRAQQRAAEDLERKVAERTEELKATHQKLMRSDRLASLGQLSASVAHEINNPISGVLNLSTLLQRILTDEGVPTPRIGEFRRYLERIEQETTRVGRIVSDLLSFSRHRPPHRAEIDLNGIVQATLSLVGHKLRLMGVEVRTELDPALPPVYCDGSQIQQVVTNLLLNGAEATHASRRGLAPVVTVRTRRGAAPETAVIEVADNGEGMTSEQLARIFQPFFTTKEEGKGVGLGLPVVYGIVHAHGGEVEVESVPEAGATFRVTLPIRERPAAGSGTPAASPEAGR
ncbi:MAG TPA: ATP-binding protein [Thermoanaerobaculia bacterium]|nr:ATP-binding protein [Thermoanaerobaculia bacterium]